MQIFLLKMQILPLKTDNCLQVSNPDGEDPMMIMEVVNGFTVLEKRFYNGRFYDVRRSRAANVIKRWYRRHYYKRMKGATTLEAIVR